MAKMATKKETTKSKPNKETPLLWYKPGDAWATLTLSKPQLTALSIALAVRPTDPPQLSTPDMIFENIGGTSSPGFLPVERFEEYLSAVTEADRFLMLGILNKNDKDVETSLNFFFPNVFSQQSYKFTVPAFDHVHTMIPVNFK